MATARNSGILRVISLPLNTALFCPFARDKVFYVDDDTNVANDGSSWTLLRI